ncbi:MAG: response regulator, partial [Planctomycetota bacterium]
MVPGKQRTLKKNGKTQIVVVDDHPIVRQGLAELINHESDLEVVGQANDAYEAMKVIKQLSPDIVITDILLGEKSGIELIKDIRIRYPDLLILAISMHDESLYAERVLRAGAKGYIMKKEGTEKLV